MSMWTAIMVISIVAIVSISRIMRAKYNAQHGVFDDRRGQPQQLIQPADTELQREVETLRERVKVLERIATDGRSANTLSDEIERLRDK